MNRSQTRKFRSLAKRKGVSHSLAEMYISMRNRGSAPQDLREGDLVRLNIEQIMKHPDYLRLSKRYRDFVETHAGDIFTVQYDRSASVQKLNSVVALKEDPDGWLFWTGGPGFACRGRALRGLQLRADELCGRVCIQAAHRQKRL